MERRFSLMVIILSTTVIPCPRCANEIPNGSLACPHCHALTHAAKLDTLAAEARKLEANHAISEAKEQWLDALALLPPESKQALWIHNHLRQLDDTAKALGIDQPSPEELAAPSFNFKPVISFIAFVLVGIQLYDVRFGIGFAVLILIHEMGHYIDIRLRGLPADMPIFLPGFGAFVRWRALGVPLATRAYVSLAGPLAGFISAVACYFVWKQNGDPLFARLAEFGGGITILNLIPVWVLDGGQAVRALGRQARIALLIIALLLSFTHNGAIFLCIFAGAIYQVFFNKNSAPDGLTPTDWNGEPESPSTTAALYFVGLLFALALLIRALP